MAVFKDTTGAMLPPGTAEAVGKACALGGGPDGKDGTNAGAFTFGTKAGAFTLSADKLEDKSDMSPCS